MEAIRKMEPAWEKVCKSNFRLTSRTIIQPNGGTREDPCYMLTKTECLYIATKRDFILTLMRQQLAAADPNADPNDIELELAHQLTERNSH